MQAGKRWAQAVSERALLSAVQGMMCGTEVHGGTECMRWSSRWPSYMFCGAVPLMLRGFRWFPEACGLLCLP